MADPQNRLLVVDDEFASRTALSRRLSRRGFAVDTAEGAGEALDKLLRDRYDLVLLDQMMPGMSGMDLLRLLRATYSPTELPVIMVTAVDQNERLVEALEEGANDYVVKPVEMPDITARIQAQLLRSRGARRPQPETPARIVPQPAAGQDGPWDWDPVSRTAHFSPRWKEIVGHQNGEIGNHLDEWLDRIHPHDLVRVRQQLNAHMDGALPEFRCEHRLRHKNGKYRWVLCRGVALRSAEGTLLRLAGSLSDIDTVRGADPLTGLCNRPQLIEKLEACLAPGDGGMLPVAVLLVDIDGLRVINQTRGHETGDRVLIEIAGRLRKTVAGTPHFEGATVARVGGDEFAVLCHCPGATCDVGRLAEAILTAIVRPIAVEDHPLQITASVGVVISSGTGHGPDQLLRDADLALCQAQELGRNRWHLYEPSLRHRAQASVVIARDLRYATERHELLAVYQPKVVIPTGRIAGFEALLRWRHPELGVVMPRDFIPMAEQTGMIVPAGEWILREACRQLKAWLQEFLVDPPLSIGVNLSARQLSDPNLANVVRRALEDSGIPPHCLRLELTESALVAEREAARSVLAEIQRMGVGFELDDFGTGYSSLSYLNLLRFDALKIDRSFVGRLETDPESRVITRTVMALARELGMDVVAEGIETEAQVELLQEMGCRYGQGYYFSMPVEAAAARDLLRAGVDEPAPSAA